MTKRPGMLSKNDLRFLISLLDKAEEADIWPEVHGDNNNKRVASLKKRQIMRIRLALIDFDKKGREQVNRK